MPPPMPGSMPQDPFTEDQKQYLEGFIAGIAKKSAMAVPNRAAEAVPAPVAAAEAPSASDASAPNFAAETHATSTGNDPYAEH